MAVPSDHREECKEEHIAFSFAGLIVITAFVLSAFGVSWLAWWLCEISGLNAAWMEGFRMIIDIFK